MRNVVVVVVVVVPPVGVGGVSNSMAYCPRPRRSVGPKSSCCVPTLDGTDVAKSEGRCGSWTASGIAFHVSVASGPALGGSGLRYVPQFG